jgi:cytochrome c551/c552
MKKLITVLFCTAVSFSAMAGGNVAAGKAVADKYSCFACHGKDYNTRSTRAIRSWPVSTRIIWRMH